MNSKSLPNDLIEHILLMRDIFIVTKYEPCWEMSTWNILGIFNTLHESQNKIIDYVIKEDIRECTYIPSKRFKLQSYGFLGKKMWIDTWQNIIGVYEYTIEIWCPNSEKPSKKIYFNFDAYIKRHIAEEKLDDDDVVKLIQNWKESKFIEGFRSYFSEEKDTKCEIIDKDEWYYAYDDTQEDTE